MCGVLITRGAEVLGVSERPLLLERASEAGLETA